MQDNNIKTGKDAVLEKKEESYGGFQYKHNYDEYKKELIEKQEGKKSDVWLTALIIIGFVVLLTGISILITDAVLKTKGTSLAGLLRGTTPVISITDDTALSEKSINELASGYTVKITAGDSSGSGVVLTENGYIATCASLIGDSDEVNVVLPDGTSAKAAVAGIEPSCDLCVLKTDASGLKHAELGYSRALVSGQRAYCRSASSSSLEKVEIISQNSSSFIEIKPKYEAAGAALINQYGHVVGVISSRSGKPVHMDVLLPYIKTMIGSSSSLLITHTPVYIELLDVYVENVTAKQSDLYKLPEGCFVTSAGASSQLKKGDIIVEVNGTAVPDTEALLAVTGTGFEVRIYRGNSYTEVTVNN